MNPNPHYRPPEPARIVVRNRATFCEEVEHPELIAGLLAKLPPEDRTAYTAAGSFALTVGGCPEHCIIFDAVHYDPTSCLWTLYYVERRVALPLYEFWYMPVEEHYSGRKFK